MTSLGELAAYMPVSGSFATSMVRICKKASTIQYFISLQKEVSCVRLEKKGVCLFCFPRTHFLLDLSIYGVLTILRSKCTKFPVNNKLS